MDLVRYYDITMKRMEELKKGLDNDTDFDELYRDVTEANSILMQNNDKLLKEANQLLKAYEQLFNKINVKIK